MTRIKLGCLVVVVLLGGAIAFAVYQRNHNPFVKVLTGSDQSFATQPVAVRMGQVTLSIPRNYFRSYPGYGGREGVPDSAEFSIRTLWPGFEPFSPATRAEFERPGLGREVGISVRYKVGVLTGKKLFAANYRGNENKKINETAFEYKMYTDITDNFFRGTIVNPRDFIYCFRDPAPRDGLPFYPYCKRIVKIGDDIVAEIVFLRDYLPQAQEIERQAITFLDSFRVSGPALEFIE